ncbi:alkaline phosphatase family protein [Enteractinococcus coprophilus]|uniref:Putative AlkP superfamily pyrophosphatase or phosphodiesterase n=1 Tax=Enteractinococcus coprophilus TaxID=1027633 RepID=A0A543AJQ7_9MICC|nr:nucleotide pyrophosphatase/phosphodiesterase family protein [Enteractinococcus coprophilus]TQL72792.1 putative AlkP superfamily pyrophosphatase or phosphodiesterase [Enteractinococcus coprophilus]
MSVSIPTGYNTQRNLTHVLPSLAAALGAPTRNHLDLPQASSAILLMVDGLGREQLERYAAHAPFFRRVMQDQTSVQTEMSSVYPSTTAAALSSLGTALSPGEHGLVGYDVYDPGRQVVINQLGGWDERTDPEVWQPAPTIFQQLNDQRQAGVHNIRPVTISLSAFEDSALTRASLQGPRFVGANELGERFVRGAAAARQPGALIYLYVNELDKAGHQHGPGSNTWLEVLEDIDSHARRMIRKLPNSTLVAVTGDHGMIEVKEERRVDFSQHGELIEHIAHTAGEPRMVQLHFDPKATEAQREKTQNAWVRRFGEQAWVVTRQQAIDAGWFGTVSQNVRQRIGDLLVTGFEPVALYDGRRAAPHSFAMVGHHGAPTSAEVRVPWLLLQTP